MHPGPWDARTAGVAFDPPHPPFIACASLATRTVRSSIIVAWDRAIRSGDGRDRPHPPPIVPPKRDDVVI